MKRETHDVSRLKSVTDDWFNHSSRQRSYKSPVISQILRNSTEMFKFCGKGQIPRLGSKFRGPRKTVGPNHHFVFLHKPDSIFQEMFMYVVRISTERQTGHWQNVVVKAMLRKPITSTLMLGVVLATAEWFYISLDIIIQIISETIFQAHVFSRNPAFSTDRLIDINKSEPNYRQEQHEKPKHNTT